MFRHSVPLQFEGAGQREGSGRERDSRSSMLRRRWRCFRRCSPAIGAAPAAQSNWPNKPIRYIVPFAPGGTTDILARTIGERLGAALGQPITTYVNMISGPRKEHELDGPQEVHLVLLDNGRSQAFADSELRQTLNCIRCGACMNHCPVYTRIGGHAYGEVYPGPIGKIITPHMVGLAKVPDHPSASSLCGACGEVCPVKIPIPALLRRLREENVKAPDSPHPVMRGQGSKYSRKERFIWNAWARLNSSPTLYRLFGFFATRLRALAPSNVGPWTQNHSAPKPAARSLHDMAREHLAKQGDR